MLIKLRHQIPKRFEECWVSTNESIPFELTQWCIHHKVQTLAILSPTIEYQSIQQSQGPKNIWILEDLPDYMGDFLLYAYGVDACLSFSTEPIIGQVPFEHTSTKYSGVQATIFRSHTLRDQIVHSYAQRLLSLAIPIGQIQIQIQQTRLIRFLRELITIWTPNQSENIFSLVAIEPITLAHNDSVWNYDRAFKALTKLEKDKKEGTVLISSNQSIRLQNTSVCNPDDFWARINHPSMLMGLSPSGDIVFRRQNYPIIDPILQILKTVQCINQESIATQSLQHYRNAPRDLPL